ncbi:MAG: CvpA family protein [Treponema sp.]|nr:CvpA family protein [Treponema sp.]
MSFTIIDWVFSLIILAFAIGGIIKGFIDNIFGKLALVLGIFIAILFYKNIAALLLKDIKFPFAANIIAFLLIFVVVFLIVKIIQMIVSKVFEWSILKSLDRTLGFFFGIVEGAVVICLIILLLDAQPFINVNSLFDGSFYYNLVSTLLTARKEAGINV